MSKKVICAITIGDVETKKSNTYWLSSDDYEKYSEILSDFIEAHEKGI